MILTKAQKEIIILAKEKGYILLNDKFKFYSTELSFQNAINRLITLGYLESDRNVLGKFNYRGKQNRAT